jgi:FMN-dependent oxidoreductase (nitrilotriacetate monooxygenase family)
MRRCGVKIGEAVMFHMGWFVGVGYSVHGWNQPWSGDIAADWIKPDLYIDLGRSLERAGFDSLMLEDGHLVPDSYKGAPDWFLQAAWMVPKADPMPLVPLIGQATNHIGIIVTLPTSFYPPFIAARLAATLDHVTDGRVGLNIVTAHNDRSAQNFGLDKHYEHDLRYEMADEWMEVVNRLWSSWEDGAVLADVSSGRFADAAKVHTIDFSGRFYKSRGPLNLYAGPQGRPVICQAGGSPAGRSFAAKHADTILARFRTIETAKAFRDDIHQLMIGHGRKTSDCKILYMMTAVIDESDDAARERHQRLIRAADEQIEYKLAFMSYASGIDFSKFDLDQPVPEVKTNAAQASTTALTKAANKKTLREVVMDPASGGFDFVGSPETIAAKMGEVMETVGGDGYLVSHVLTRRSVAEVTDGLAPALQRRSLIRTSYTHRRFRDNLLAY